jgi:hypothetical protein
MSSTPAPKSASNQTAQPTKTPPAWSADRADTLRQAAHKRGPGACQCGVHKGDPRIPR